MHVQDNFEAIIAMCECHPRDEEMLMLKARCLKSLDKTYKYLECLERVLKINPQNINALLELAEYMKKQNI